MTFNSPQLDSNQLDTSLDLINHILRSSNALNLQYVNSTDLQQSSIVHQPTAHHFIFV